MALPRSEVRRKGWHMASGVAVAPMVVYTHVEYFTIVAVGAFIFIGVAETLRIRWGIRLPFWSDQIDLARRRNERVVLASLAFVATIVALVWLTPLPVAFAASAQLALGDGMSALVGRAIGRTALPHNRAKTWEGSMAGFLIGASGAFVIVIWYAWVSGAEYRPAAVAAVCLFGSFFAMLAESLPRLEDNVTVPLFAGVSMTAAWWAFGLEPGAGYLFLRI